MIFILEHELANNYELVEASCKTAIQYHEKKKHFNSVEKLLGFYIKLLATYIPLQKFQAVKTKLSGTEMSFLVAFFIALLTSMLLFRL